MFARSNPASVAVSLVLFVVFVFGALAAPRAVGQDIPAPVYELSGSVQDPQGEPVEGAEVLLRELEGDTVATTETDATGAYRFLAQDAGTYRLSASHDCCLGVSVEIRLGETALLNEAEPLVLRERPEVQSGDPVRISGLVTDQDDGSGVPGAWIEIYSYYGDDGASEPQCDGDVCWASPRSVQYFQVQSDSFGAFEVDINRGSAGLSAYLDGYDGTDGEFSATEDRELEVPMRKSAGQSVRLHGILRDLEGNPISSGWVSVGPDYGGCSPYSCMAESSSTATTEDASWRFHSTQNQYNSTETADDGFWELRITPGSLRVSAYAEDHIEESEALVAENGDDRLVELVLERIPADSVTVRGRVTDRSTGEPVSGAQVGLENQKWGTHAWGETDEDGRFEVLTKPGYTVLTVSAYRYYVQMCAVPEPMPPQEAPDEPESSPEILAVSTTTMTTSASSEPTETATAKPSSDDYAYSSTCEPQDRGNDYYPAVRSFNALEGESLTFDVALLARPSPSSKFQGYVLDAESGEAIEGAVVTFYNEATRDWGTAPTDQDGSYSIMVHPGYYSIRIWAEGHFDGVANAEIGEDASQRLDFELAPGQKRYGYWAYGGYDVAVAHSSGPMGGPDSAPEGPPRPSGGQQAYTGAGGDLGPYHPASVDGASSTPGVTPMVLLGALAALVVFARRRQG